MPRRRQRGCPRRGEDLIEAARGTLRARATAVAWSLAFVGGVLLLATPIAVFAALAGAPSLEEASASLQRPGPAQLVAQSIGLLVAGVALTWLIGVKANRLTWADLRYERGARARRGLVVGLGLGVLAATVALLLAAGPGTAGWSDDAGSPVAWVGAVAGTLAILAPAALAEEVIFRGVPLVLLAAAFGRLRALVAVSVAFGLGHLGNPNALALGIVNIVLAGIFLGLAFYAPGGIWTAFGAHLGWNGALAALDAPVSGLPFSIPAIDYEPGSPAWLTGGAFGPEGGLAATAAFAVAAWLVARYSRKETA